MVFGPKVQSMQCYKLKGDVNISYKNNKELLENPEGILVQCDFINSDGLCSLMKDMETDKISEEPPEEDSLCYLKKPFI